MEENIQSAQGALPDAAEGGIVESIESKILNIRGKQVMLDRDLAVLYGVETKRLNEQVRRNVERFPADFMFQLTRNEYNDLKSQFDLNPKIQTYYERIKTQCRRETKTC